MKCFRRCLCVLACLALLSGVFCVGVSAEEIETQGYNINHQSWLAYRVKSSGATKWNELFSLPISVGDGEMQYTSKEYTVLKSDWTAADNYRVHSEISLTLPNNKILFESGRPITFKFDRVYYSILYESMSGQYEYVNKPTDIRLTLTYNDGTTQDVTDVSVTYANGRSMDISATFTPDKDVIKVNVITNYYLKDFFGSSDRFFVADHAGEWDNDGNNYILSIERSSEEAGLLSGIKGFVNDIKNKVTEVTETVKNLPQTIWQKIEDGLKSLFVPDDEYMENYKDRWTQLLSEKLGAVWQVGEITFGAWDDITASDATNTIAFPEISINLPDNAKFTFGGYDVQLVPDGFDVVVTALKTIIGIACTILFINGLRKRYDEVMGGQ